MADTPRKINAAQLAQRKMKMPKSKRPARSEDSQAVLFADPNATAQAYGTASSFSQPSSFSFSTPTEQSNNPFASTQSSSFTFGQNQSSSAATPATPAFGGFGFQPSAAPIQQQTTNFFSSQPTAAAQPSTGAFVFGQSQPQQNQGSLSFGNTPNGVQQSSNMFGTSQQPADQNSSFTFGASQPNVPQTSFSSNPSQGSFSQEKPGTTPFTFGISAPQSSIGSFNNSFNPPQQPANAPFSSSPSPAPFTFGAPTNSQPEQPANKNSIFSTPAKQPASNVFGGLNGSAAQQPTNELFSFGKGQNRSSEPPPSSPSTLQNKNAIEQPSSVFTGLTTTKSQTSNPFASLGGQNRQSEPPQSSTFSFSAVPANAEAPKFSSISTQDSPSSPAFKFTAQTQSQPKETSIEKPTTSNFEFSSPTPPAEIPKGKPASSLFDFSSQTRSEEVPEQKLASSFSNFAGQSMPEQAAPATASLFETSATNSLFGAPKHSEASTFTTTPFTPSPFSGFAPLNTKPALSTTVESPQPGIQTFGILGQTSQSKQNAVASSTSTGLFAKPADIVEAAKPPAAAAAAMFDTPTSNIFSQSSLIQAAPPPSPKPAAKVLSNSDTVLPSIERQPNEHININDIDFVDDELLESQLIAQHPTLSAHQRSMMKEAVKMRTFNDNFAAYFASVPSGADHSSAMRYYLRKMEEHKTTMSRPSRLQGLEKTKPPQSASQNSLAFSSPLSSTSVPADGSTTPNALPPAPSLPSQLANTGNTALSSSRLTASPATPSPASPFPSFAIANTSTTPKAVPPKSLFSAQSTFGSVSAPEATSFPNTNGKRNATSQVVEDEVADTGSEGHRAKQYKANTVMPATPVASSEPISTLMSTPKTKRKAEFQLTKDDPTGEEAETLRAQRKIAKPSSETHDRFKTIIDKAGRHVANGDKPARQPETPAKANPFASLIPATAPAAYAPKPASFGTSTPGTSRAASSSDNMFSTASNAMPNVATKPDVISFGFKPSVASDGSAIKPPSFGSGSSSFLADFGNQAKKNAEEEEKKRLQRAKDEDLDSDEDEAEFEAKWRETRAKEKKDLEESAAKPTISFGFKPSSATAAVKPPSFGSGPSSFLSDFGNQAKKNAEEEERKALEKAKDEELDSDDDVAKFEAQWREKRARNKKEIEEAASKSAAFLPGKGFVFKDGAQANKPAKPVEAAQASKPLLGQSLTGSTSSPTAPMPKANNIFGFSQPAPSGGLFASLSPTATPNIFGQRIASTGAFAPPSRSETSSPGALSSTSSVFDSQEVKNPVTFGTPLLPATGQDNADEESTEDDQEDNEDQENSDPNAEKNDPSYDPERDEDAQAETPVEETGPGLASQKKPSAVFSFAQSTSGSGTPNKPANSTFSFERANATNADTSSFALSTNGANPFASLNKAPSNTPPSDKTWNQNTPIKFGTSPSTTQTSPSFNVFPPTSTKTSPFAGLFGSNTTPKSTLFAGLHTEKVIDKPAGTTGFTFGKASTTTSLFPSATGSAITSRATTPGATTDNDSVAETNSASNDPDAEHHEQIDLASGGAGEEEEDVIYLIRAKALQFDSESAAWKTKGLGPLKVLKHKTSGSSRVLLRADPAGNIVLNKSIIPNVTYEATKKTVKLVTADESGKGLETWILQVKTEESATALAKALEENKNGR